MIDKELHSALERFKLGDREGFIMIYNLYLPKVYHFCLSMTRCPQDAEEITSDVFVKIWQKRAIVDTSGSLLPLLLKITRDLTWNYLRKLARVRAQNASAESFLDISKDQTDDALIFTESEEIIKQALEKLTPQQQRIFSLRYITGKDLNQISEELQISKNTVKVHLAKSKRMLLHLIPINTT